MRHLCFAFLLPIATVLYWQLVQAVVQFEEPDNTPKQPPYNEYDVRNVNSSQMNKMDWKVVLCDDLPRTAIPDCRGIDSFKVHIRKDKNNERLMRPGNSANGRKKRHGDYYGSRYNGYDRYNRYRGPYYRYPPPNYNRSSTDNNVYICPTPVNQSAPYQLSSDPTNYPADDIGNELGRNMELSNCLFRTVVLDDTPPLVIEDDFRETAVATCPYTEQRLWQYQSPAQGQRCWVLANFDDYVFYRECTQRFCLNCATVGQNNSIQNLCITDYRAMSFWAYCPNNPEGSRIVRDRIILPLACACQSVQCDPVPSNG